MAEALIYGIAIFILGIAAGVLGTLWWTSRSKKENSFSAQIANEQKHTQAESRVVEPEQITPLQTPKISQVYQVEGKKGKKILEKSTPVAQPVDMVTAINDILQEMIRHSDAPSQIISLSPEPPVGVTVWVNGKGYTDLNAVDDPKSKELLRKAVAEWERRVAEKE
jgi:hypothetical protein